MTLTFSRVALYCSGCNVLGAVQGGAGVRNAVLCSVREREAGLLADVHAGGIYRMPNGMPSSRIRIKCAYNGSNMVAVKNNYYASLSRAGYVYRKQMKKYFFNWREKASILPHIEALSGFSFGELRAGIASHPSTRML